MPAHAPIEFGLLEHTADTGIWLYSTDIITIYSELPRILGRIMVSGPRQGPLEAKRVELDAPAPEILLADLASEVVYLLDAEGTISTSCDIISFNNISLTADIQVCAFDPEIHQIQMAVKAVTYYQASLKAVSSGWRAELYLDV